MGKIVQYGVWISPKLVSTKNTTLFEILLTISGMLCWKKFQELWSWASHSVENKTIYDFPEFHYSLALTAFLCAIPAKLTSSPSNKPYFEIHYGRNSKMICIHYLLFISPNSQYGMTQQNLFFCVFIDVEGRFASFLSYPGILELLSNRYISFLFGYVFQFKNILLRIVLQNLDLVQHNFIAC